MGLVLQFIPYSEIEDLGPARRVNKLLDIAKQNKIVLLEGRLKKEEEKDLIEITMEEVPGVLMGAAMTALNMNMSDRLPDAVRQVMSSLAQAPLPSRVSVPKVHPKVQERINEAAANALNGMHGESIGDKGAKDTEPSGDSESSSDVEGDADSPSTD